MQGVGVQGCCWTGPGVQVCWGTGVQKRRAQGCRIAGVERCRRAGADGLQGYQGAGMENVGVHEVAGWLVGLLAGLLAKWGWAGWMASQLAGWLAGWLNRFVCLLEGIKAQFC